MAEKILEVKHLTTSFRTERGVMDAVQGVSFYVRKGEILGLVGESGCGKSVTSQSIMRLYDEKRFVRYDGKILFDGEDLLQLPERKMQQVRGKDIAMVFQDSLSALNPVFTCGEQIMEAMRIHQKMPRKQARAEAIEMLRLVGIPSPETRVDQYPHELSGGMRQRVMIACALSCRPKLLIADEPTTALDVTIQAQILKLLKKLNQKHGISMLFISHNLNVVRKLCKRVAVMQRGVIVEEGLTNDVFFRPQHPYTQHLIECIPARVKVIARRNAEENPENDEGDEILESTVKAGGERHD